MTEPFHSIYKNDNLCHPKKYKHNYAQSKKKIIMMETLKRHKLQRSKYLEKIVNTLKFLSNEVMLIKYKGKKKIKWPNQQNC